jgi:hypothetical protein
MKQPNTLFGQNTKRLNVEVDGTLHTAVGLLKPITAFLQTAVTACRTSCGRHLSQATLARPLWSDITSWRHFDAHTCAKQTQHLIGAVWRKRVRILAGSSFTFDIHGCNNQATLSNGAAHKSRRDHVFVSFLSRSRHACAVRLPSTTSQFPTRR